MTPSFLETLEIANVAAEEVLAAYREIEDSHWDGNNPVRHNIVAPSLAGVAFTDTLSYSLAYGEKTRLRRGHGIITSISHEDGVCTGEVRVQPACDDFDL